jgi:hypothetical protein
MDTKLLKKVRKIEIKTRRLSHIFSEYHTSFKGRGMTFVTNTNMEMIRAIDWNVTARYNEAHVKVFEEERELTMMSWSIFQGRKVLALKPI